MLYIFVFVCYVCCCYTYAVAYATILSYLILEELVMKLPFDLSGFILSFSLSLNKHFLLFMILFCSRHCCICFIFQRGWTHPSQCELCFKITTIQQRLQSQRCGVFPFVPSKQRAWFLVLWPHMEKYHVKRLDTSLANCVCWFKNKYWMVEQDQQVSSLKKKKKKWATFRFQYDAARRNIHS